MKGANKLYVIHDRALFEYIQQWHQKSDISILTFVFINNELPHFPANHVAIFREFIQNL
jgi:hypothetical protein